LGYLLEVSRVSNPPTAANMTGQGLDTYTYDAENRLITAGGSTYTCDGDGRRYWAAQGLKNQAGEIKRLLKSPDISKKLRNELESTLHNINPKLGKLKEADLI
jgi:hypothetical protein